MDQLAIDRLATRAGLGATLMTGLSVVLTDDPQTNAPLVVWWIAYLGFVLGFAFDTWRPERAPAWLSYELNLAVMVTSASAAYVIYPFGVTVTLLIVSSVFGAFVLSPAGTRNLIIAQSVVIGFGLWLGRESVTETAAAIVVFGAFQTFAALMVHSRRREAEAREELAEAHAELRASSAMLAESSRTAERLRIARDLHDVIGHQLTALSLELEVASHKDGANARSHALKARDIAKDLLTDVRDTVGEMRQDRPGLEPALRALVDELTQIEVDLTVREAVDLDERLAMDVVRCIQEVITNTLRHAQANRLSIDVTADRNGVTVSARDDGRGCDDVRVGHGLTGMRERIASHGGRMSVRSAAGEGFTVTTWMPTGGSA